MKTIISKVLVATENQQGAPYINKNGDPFQMLHIQLEDWTRASKYYPIDATVPTITEWKEYEVSITQNGIYTNITSISHIVTVDEFIEAAKRYGFGLDEEQTWKMAKEMEKCTEVSDCEAVVMDFMESGALNEIRAEISPRVI